MKMSYLNQIWHQLRFQASSQSLVLPFNFELIFFIYLSFLDLKGMKMSFVIIFALQFISNYFSFLLQLTEKEEIRNLAFALIQNFYPIFPNALMSTLDSSTSDFFNLNNSALTNKQACCSTTSASSYISELILIQEQSELLETIHKSLLNSASKQHQSSMLSHEVTDISFEIPASAHFIDVSMSCTDIRRELSFSTTAINIDSPQLERALREIGAKCCRKTFSLIKNELLGNAERRAQLKLEKEKKFNAELTHKLARLNEKLIEYEMRLGAVNAECESLRDGEITSKKKISDSQKNSIDRQARFIKWEQSLIYKEKTIAAARNKIEKQLQLIDEEKTVNENIIQRIEEFFKTSPRKKHQQSEPNLETALSQVCKGIRAKEQILKEKEKCIEKHYEEIRELVQRNRGYKFEKARS